MTTGAGAGAGQIPLALRLDAGATLASFHPGDNRSALAQVRSAVAGPAWLYLWGGTGTGKTHLLNAACQAAGGSRTACLVPFDQAADWRPEALSGLQGIDMVALDSLDSIAGQRDWEVAVFNLLNGLRESGGSVLMAGRKRPASLDLTLPDLRSRLGWGTLVRLQAMSDEDKIQALRLRAHLRGFELPDDVAGYLLRRVARDSHSLFRLLDRLDDASLAAQRRITVPFLRQTLERDAEDA